MIFMRYTRSSKGYKNLICGTTYTCDHPVYIRCTLFFENGKGLTVIQQRYSAKTKHTWWTEIDPELTGEIYFNPKFDIFFKERAGKVKNGIFPTVTVRQIMWALRMKPLPKQRWETVFDHRDI